MKPRIYILLASILLAVAGPVRAETLFGGLAGRVCWWLMAAHEHSPECLGSRILPNEPFHVDGAGSDRCSYAWRIHCDADSLALDFTADPDPETWLPFRLIWGYYGSDDPVVATLIFNGPVELTAWRLGAALPDTAVQTVTLTPAGGQPQELLGEGTAQNEVTVILTPGTYEVTLDVLAEIWGDPDPDLRSYVRVSWREVTGGRDRASWGGVKAIYRNAIR